MFNQACFRRTNHLSVGTHVTVKFRKQATALFEGLIFGGAYIRREVCISKLARLILGGKFASQNQLG